MIRAKSPEQQEREEIAEVRRWVEDPLYWGRKFLSSEDRAWEPSPQQRQLWEAYRALFTAKYKRFLGKPLKDSERQIVDRLGISVRAGQGLGKEATVAGIGLHFMQCAPEPKVVCTAPAGPTLFSTLWPEFSKWINQSRYLPELFTKQSEKIYLTERGGETFAIRPRTIQQNSAPDQQAEVLAGIHSISVLYLVTEASGVPEAVWKPLEGGGTDPISIIILIYNPTRNQGYAIETQRKYRQFWTCLHWDAEDMAVEARRDPKTYFWFNPSAQEKLAAKYGRDSNFYRIRVKGLPPRQADDTLIAWDDVVAATERDLVVLPTDPLVVSVDVAGPSEGENTDKSIILTRQGPVVKAIQEYSGRDTTQLARLASGTLKDYLPNCSAVDGFAVGIDAIGIGRGVYDHCINVERMARCYAIESAERPCNVERFHRLRDEMWWWARERFMELRDIQIPNDDELIEELTAIKWREEENKIKVESKPDLVKRLRRSPNKADAFIMSEFLLRRCTSSLPVAAQRRTRERRALHWRIQ